MYLKQSEEVNSVRSGIEEGTNKPLSGQQSAESNEDLILARPVALSKNQAVFNKITASKSTL
jgi:hypothetical protein